MSVCIRKVPKSSMDYGYTVVVDRDCDMFKVVARIVDDDSDTCVVTPFVVDEDAKRVVVTGGMWWREDYDGMIFVAEMEEDVVFWEVFVDCVMRHVVNILYPGYGVVVMTTTYFTKLQDQWVIEADAAAKVLQNVVPCDVAHIITTLGIPAWATDFKMSVARSACLPTNINRESGYNEVVQALGVVM